MTYDTPNNRRNSRGSRSSLQGSGRTRTRVNVGQGSYHGPIGTQQRSGSRGGRLRSGGGSGYPLRTRNINFQGGRRRRFSDRRMIVAILLAVVLLVLLVVGISSCVRGCSSNTAQETESQNQLDSRVAAGVSDDLTKRFSAALDQNDKLAQIAAKADQYGDTALLELALDEPGAIDLVYAYPDADKTAGQAYGESVTQGSAPTLYTWDARWGAVGYGEHALALTGSGPTALSMAYMGLTGNADKTPADIAALAVAKGSATGESGTDAAFFESVASDLGLSVKSHESSSESISEVLDSGTYLLIEAKAGTLTDEAHWVLAVTENSDGTVVVFDPTSPTVTAASWTPTSLASACDTFYAVTLPASDATTDADVTE